MAEAQPDPPRRPRWKVLVGAVTAALLLPILAFPLVITLAFLAPPALLMAPVIGFTLAWPMLKPKLEQQRKRRVRRVLSQAHSH